MKRKRTTTMLTRATGFTQFELLVVLGIIAILAVFAVPSFRTMQERNEVIAAAEALSADLRWARSEALKRGGDGVQVKFSPQAKPSSDKASLWSYVITAPPDPSPPNPSLTINSLKTVNNILVNTIPLQLDNVSMTKTAFTSSNKTTFSVTHGTAAAGSAAFVSHYQTYKLAVVLSGFGRVSICFCPDSEPMGGYQTCNPTPPAACT